jgi:hypothetical protein
MKVVCVWMGKIIRPTARNLRSTIVSIVLAALYKIGFICLFIYMRKGYGAMLLKDPELIEEV